MKETRENHPSFGVVRVSHVSGNTRLNGTEFQHQHFISLTVQRAEKIRDLSREWWFGREELIEIHLSEAQFVELMARPNMGSGVPCTVRHIQGERQPDPPEPKTMRERHRDDFQADANRCARDLDEATAELGLAIEQGRLGKATLKGILAKLTHASMAVKDGMPFVQRQFESAMETVTHHAAVEIEATVASVAMRLGVEEMRRIGATTPRLLDQGDRFPEENRLVPAEPWSDDDEDRATRLAEDMIAQGGTDLFCYQDARAMVMAEKQRAGAQVALAKANLSGKIESMFRKGYLTDAEIANELCVPTCDITALRRQWRENS